MSAGQQADDANRHYRCPRIDGMAFGVAINLLPRGAAE